MAEKLKKLKCARHECKATEINNININVGQNQTMPKYDPEDKKGAVAKIVTFLNKVIKP